MFGCGIIVEGGDDLAAIEGERCPASSSKLQDIGCRLCHMQGAPKVVIAVDTDKRDWAASCVHVCPCNGGPCQFSIWVGGPTRTIASRVRTSHAAADSAQRPQPAHRPTRANVCLAQQNGGDNDAQRHHGGRSYELCSHTVPEETDLCTGVGPQRPRPAIGHRREQVHR